VAFQPGPESLKKNKETCTISAGQILCLKGERMNTKVEKEETAGYMIYNEEIKDLLIDLDKSYQSADMDSFNTALAKIETLIPSVDSITLDSISRFLSDLGSWKIDAVKKLTFN
jgi:hypothetical protein